MCDNTYLTCVLATLHVKLVFMKHLLLSLLALGLLTSHANAQDNLPELPDPLKNLAAEGAQLRYLGDEKGLDGWVAIKNGTEQYFYVMPDGQSFMMGILFDNSGDVITIDQVRRLQSSGDATLEELTKDPMFAIADSRKAQVQNKESLSPSERLFADLSDSNWFVMGAPDAPALYAIIDPQCPHCHAFLNDVRSAGLLENGTLQLRIIPVGFRDQTKAQAAYLMAAPDPSATLIAHLDGDENALPVRSDINQQGVERNLTIMQSWKLGVTPMVFYRAHDGKVKVVRGRPQDLDTILKDLRG